MNYNETTWKGAFVWTDLNQFSSTIFMWWTLQVRCGNKMAHGVGWSNEATQLLISLWGQSEVQEQLSPVPNIVKEQAITTLRYSVIPHLTEILEGFFNTCLIIYSYLICPFWKEILIYWNLSGFDKLSADENKEL